MAEILPLILQIVGIGAGATSIGTSLYSAMNQPGEAKPTVPPGPSAEDANKTKQGQIAALSQQFPGIQAATGGSLSPEAWIRMAELLSSKAGTPGIGAAEQDILKLLSDGGSNVSVGGGSGSGTSTGTAGLTPGGSYG
jgi:hypothetical protein